MRKQRWTEDDKQRFTEQKPRSTSIPPKRSGEPLPSEWDYCSESDESTC